MKNKMYVFGWILLFVNIFFGAINLINFINDPNPWSALGTLAGVVGVVAAISIMRDTY